MSEIPCDLCDSEDDCTPGDYHLMLCDECREKHKQFAGSPHSAEAPPLPMSTTTPDLRETPDGACVDLGHAIDKISDALLDADLTPLDELRLRDARAILCRVRIVVSGWRSPTAQASSLVATASSPPRASTEDEIAALRAELTEWEEREAACCPEDVGFREYIAYLTDRCVALTIRLGEIVELATKRIVPHRAAQPSVGQPTSTPEGQEPRFLTPGFIAPPKAKR